MLPQRGHVFKGPSNSTPQKPQKIPERDDKTPRGEESTTISARSLEERRLIISLKLYGVFRSSAGSPSIQLELPSDTPTVRTAIAVLSSHSSYQALVRLLLNDQTADPRPNALIMVSGREISSRNGLDTPLLEGDELSLLPVAHGG